MECFEKLENMQHAMREGINVLKETVNDHHHKIDYLKRERDTQREEINNLRAQRGDYANEEIYRPPALAPQGCKHRGTGTLIVPQDSPRLEGHDLEMDSWLAHLRRTTT